VEGRAGHIRLAAVGGIRVGLLIEYIRTWLDDPLVEASTFLDRQS
jgi:hypothetical protein